MLYGMKTIYIVLFLIGLFSIPGLNYATIYKSVDAQGNVTFTDSATPGAQQLPTETVQTYSTPNTSTTQKNQSKAVAAKDTKSYESIKIITPKDKDTIQSNEGNLSVQALITPNLKQTDKMRVMIDGINAEEIQGLSSAQVIGINRGQHSLQILIIGSNGTVLKASPTVTFYMQKVGLNSPTVKARMAN